MSSPLPPQPVEAEDSLFQTQQESSESAFSCLLLSNKMPVPCPACRACMKNVNAAFSELSCPNRWRDGLNGQDKELVVVAEFLLIHWLLNISDKTGESIGLLLAKLQGEIGQGSRKDGLPLMIAIFFEMLHKRMDSETNDAEKHTVIRDGVYRNMFQNHQKANRKAWAREILDGGNSEFLEEENSLYSVEEYAKYADNTDKIREKMKFSDLGYFWTSIADFVECYSESNKPKILTIRSIYLVTEKLKISKKEVKSNKFKYAIALVVIVGFFLLLKKNYDFVLLAPSNSAAGPPSQSAPPLSSISPRRAILPLDITEDNLFARLGFRDPEVSSPAYKYYVTIKSSMEYMYQYRDHLTTASDRAPECNVGPHESTVRKIVKESEDLAIFFDNIDPINQTKDLENLANNIEENYQKVRLVTESVPRICFPFHIQYKPIPLDGGGTQ